MGNCQGLLWAYAAQVTVTRDPFARGTIEHFLSMSEPVFVLGLRLQSEVGGVVFEFKSEA